MIQIEVPPKAEAWIEELVKETGKSKDFFIRKALKWSLDNLEQMYKARFKSKNPYRRSDYVDETAYLCASPKNLKRLLEALNRKEGKSLDEVRKQLGI